LVDKATSTATEKLAPGDRRGPVSSSKIANILSEHEREIARVFSPEEMYALPAGHRALELSNIERLRTGSGSDTAEKNGIIDRFLKTGLGRGVDFALRVHYGMLRTGGLIASARRLPATVLETGRQPQPREPITGNADWSMPAAPQPHSPSQGRSGWLPQTLRQPPQRCQIIVPLAIRYSALGLDWLSDFGRAAIAIVPHAGRARPAEAPFPRVQISRIHHRRCA
jgi:hypothetical protein